MQQIIIYSPEVKYEQNIIHLKNGTITFSEHGFEFSDCKDTKRFSVKFDIPIEVQIEGDFQVSFSGDLLKIYNEEIIVFVIDPLESIKFTVRDAQTEDDLITIAYPFISQRGLI